MDYKKFFHQYLSFINFLIPKPAAPAVVGIDIGTLTIKAVEIGKSVGGAEIRRWAIEPLGGNDPKIGLKKIAERLQLTNQTLISSVFGKGTLIRYVDLPRMSIDELRKSYMYELDKYFPFDPKTIYTDCAILDPAGKEKKMQVLLAAVKRELVDERLRIFKDAGLELSAITVNSIATSNAFSRLGPPLSSTDKAKAVLDIGGSASCFMIFKDASPRFTRDIFIGSNELTKKIAMALNVDAAQAEKLKQKPADKYQQIIDACDMPINNLITEIRLSIDYFMTEKNIQVDELFLTGGGALLQGLDGIFEKNLGISVKIWNPLAKAKLGGQSQASGDIQSYAAQFGVAIGMGILS